jgi:hypothetical protein
VLDDVSEKVKCRWYYECSRRPLTVSVLRYVLLCACHRARVPERAALAFPIGRTVRHPKFSG